MTQSVKMNQLNKKICKTRFQWFGHAKLNDEDYIAERIRSLEKMDKRKQGR